jgi:hypothetical protein
VLATRDQVTLTSGRGVLEPLMLALTSLVCVKRTRRRGGLVGATLLVVPKIFRVAIVSVYALSAGS